MATTTRQLDIRRIYSASPSRAAAVSTARAARLRVSVLGIITLLVAGTWIYLAWWPTDQLAMRNLMLVALRSPAAQAALGFNLDLGSAPDDLAHPAPPEGTEAVATEEGPAIELVGPDPDEARNTMQQVMQSLYVDMWVWLVVTTFAASWLAMSGGAATAGFPVIDPQKRRTLIMAAIVTALIAAWIARRLWHGQPVVGLGKPYPEIAFVTCGLIVAWILAVTLSTRAVGILAGLLAVVLVGIGGLAWRDWYSETYGIFANYPAAALRIAAVCLIVVAILAGASLSRRSVGLHRIGILLIVAATVTTMATLGYAESAGGIHTHVLSGTTYLVIGVAQLACAAVLAGTVALRLR